MTQIFHNMIAAILGISEKQIGQTLSLLNDGATIPFISRYRKEITGGLDEVQIESIKTQYDKLSELAKRKETILGTIGEQGKLTPELRQRIDATWDATALEDIYLPYKPKRKTRAEAARQKGLEPLATILMLQREPHPEQRAAGFVKGDVKDADDALKGARDIIAEQVSENERARNTLRNTFARQAVLTAKVVKGKEEEGAKYRDYFDCSESLKRCSSHRLLAIRRAETEGVLKVSISPNDEECVERLERQFVRSNNACGKQVAEAVQDAYKRLLKPSIETEFAAQSKERADDEAIRVFAENLRQLLLASPLGQKRVMGIDPGFRTGCKVVCLDAQGNLLHNENIYPHPPVNQSKEAFAKLQKMIEAYKIEAIAIGNGTASRETEEVVSEFIAEQAPSLRYTIVNEAGASVYSASELASQEYPDLDVTVRGAMSLGRRLQDPLAELVKIPPQSIGVGQYQHDLDQAELSRTLGHVVEDVVNRVGVDVNTASASLLGYVSGITPSVAKNIVAYREENGAFTDRRQLKKVPKLGPKAYLNAAGFLRISGGKNPLDATSVHPESYEVATAVLERAGVAASELSRGGVPDIERRLGSISALASDLDCGTLTLIDIVNELKKPGRDPRDDAPEVVFSRSALSIDDLEPGMELKGTVRNVVDFGAFVDVGVHQDGLVHISKLANRFVKHPSDVVRVGDTVKVWVEKVDRDRKKISLTMVQGK